MFTNECCILFTVPVVDVVEEESKRANSVLVFSDLPFPLTSPEVTYKSSSVVGDECSSVVGYESSPGVGDESSPGVGDESSPGVGDESSPGVGDESSPGVGDESSPVVGDECVRTETQPLATVSSSYFKELETYVPPPAKLKEPITLADHLLKNEMAVVESYGERSVPFSELERIKVAVCRINW